MIRQDKITFLISTLETPELYGNFKYDDSVHHKTFNIDDYAERIFKRIGIISKFETNPVKILTEYLPVNKHDFLQSSLLKFSKDYCFKKAPSCNRCYFDICCDYNNKKNDWEEWKKI